MSKEGQDKIYQMITDQVVKQLEAGHIPWRRPWNAEDGMPRSVHGHAYRGINVWLLAYEAMDKGYQDPRWVTYKQAQKKGGGVRKGEKSTVIVFWKWIVVRDRAASEAAGEPVERRIPLLRYFRVFNVEQCEGLKLPELKKAEGVEPIEAAEAVAKRYMDELGGPPVGPGSGRAYYSPMADSIGMPERDSFKSAEEYYSTLFHEFGHSTGHKSRLHRADVMEGGFDNHAYSREELTAEFCAAFLCGVTGIRTEQVAKNNAGYIEGWVKRLGRDPKMLIQGAARAQKAADWIQGVKPEDYTKDEQSEAKSA